jgi:serine/threonine-protein kinase
MELSDGVNIAPHLKLVRPLGAGGMGSVWIAEHAVLGPVAIKVLASKYEGDFEATERFWREARATSRIRSEHVVRVLDCASLDDGRPYIVMELLEGEDLERYLTRRIAEGGPLGLDETLRVVEHVADALAAAHRIGVVHRDVKPENVFVSREDGTLFATLLDFGIAKESDSSVRVTSTGATMGTPHYMSPEQLMSAREVDERCDLWGLAVVAYQCLTGRVPFDGETFGSICLSIHKGELVPPSDVLPGLPRAIDAWFARALARDIGSRWGDAVAMRDAFRVACENARHEPKRSDSAAESERRDALLRANREAHEPGDTLAGSVRSVDLARAAALPASSASSARGTTHRPNVVERDRPGRRNRRKGLPMRSIAAFGVVALGAAAGFALPSLRAAPNEFTPFAFAAPASTASPQAPMPLVPSVDPAGFATEVAEDARGAAPTGGAREVAEETEARRP